MDQGHSHVVSTGPEAITGLLSVPLRLYQDVEHFVVDGPPEIDGLAGDLEGDFTQMPSIRRRISEDTSTPRYAS